MKSISEFEDMALGGSCGGGLSFEASTKVATAQGEQAIGTLKVGEKVLAYNSKTHKMELQPILHVWINHDNDLVDLTLTVTMQSAHETLKKSEVLHTNKRHPFLTMEQGFVPVSRITLGMHVVRANGSVGVITGWSIVAGAKTMYNLEVARDHTFTVGDEQWIVHNCETPGDYLSNKAPKAVTPGTRTLEGVYVNDLGQPEQWVAHYDEYGRMIGRTDYTTGNAAQGIEPIHYHVYSHTEFFGDGRSFADHVPGVFDPNDRLSRWEFLL